LSARIRRVGNSLAVIIPKELLDEAGANEGDMISLSLSIPTSKRNSALMAAAGIDKRKRHFQRKATDRY